MNDDIFAQMTNGFEELAETTDRLAAKNIEVDKLRKILDEKRQVEVELLHREIELLRELLDTKDRIIDSLCARVGIVLPEKD